MIMDFRRILQVIQYGWKHAKIVALTERTSRPSAFIDILSCYRKYHLWSNQYIKERFYSLDKTERERIGSKYREKNDKYEKIIKDKLENRLFLNKWKSYYWELGYQDRRRKRQAAYAKRYNMGENCDISFDVHIECNHFLQGQIKIGNNVMLSKHVYIDYSGEVVLSDDVKLSSSVVIESHRHDFVPDEKEYKAIPTSVVIDNGVWVGQHAIICEDCKRIGRYAQIGAGAVVRNPIPPYAIVLGNPAKIVGFLYTPEEVVDFEKNKYPEVERTDIVKYTKQYEKFFINRMSEIKNLLNN
jgi:acetyltransferase-like isoleucine patch superfamily enzyme